MPAQILALSLRRAPSRALREESHRIASTSDTFRRCYHTTRKLHDTPNREPQSLDARTPFQIPKIRTRTPEKLVYKMTFTCKPCSARSTHEVSKQGYHHGSVLITCPDCKNRHVISDHLKIFGEKPTTLEALMKEHGQLVKKGSLSGDGNFEIWEDGTVTDAKKSEST